MRSVSLTAKIAARREDFDRYNELYAKAQEVLTRINPCEIAIVDGKASCVSSRDAHERDENLCCQGCGHLSTVGCTIKALACKLWLCMYVESTPKGKQAKKELFEIERQAYADDLSMPYRSSPFVIL